MKAKLSPTQVETLRHMAEGGVMRRYPGGFWTTDDDAAKGNTRPGSRAPADWWIECRTLRALQRFGFVERVGDYSEEYRDSRRLTDAGRKAAHMAAINRRLADGWAAAMEKEVLK